MRKIKIAIVGANGCGKTNFVNSLIGVPFNPHHITTMGSQFTVLPSPPHQLQLF